MYFAGATKSVLYLTRGGGGGIRTHGALRHNGFRDRPIRPLSHPSGPVTYYSVRSESKNPESNSPHSFALIPPFHGVSWLSLGSESIP